MYRHVEVLNTFQVSCDQLQVNQEVLRELFVSLGDRSVEGVVSMGRLRTCDCEGPMLCYVPILQDCEDDDPVFAWFIDLMPITGIVLFAAHRGGRGHNPEDLSDEELQMMRAYCDNIVSILVAAQLS